MYLTYLPAGVYITVMQQACSTKYEIFQFDLNLLIVYIYHIYIYIYI